MRRIIVTVLSVFILLSTGYCENQAPEPGKLYVELKSGGSSLSALAYGRVYDDDIPMAALAADSTYDSTADDPVDLVFRELDVSTGQPQVTEAELKAGTYTLKIWVDDNNDGSAVVEDYWLRSATKVHESTIQIDDDTTVTVESSGFTSAITPVVTVNLGLSAGEDHRAYCTLIQPEYTIDSGTAYRYGIFRMSSNLLDATGNGTTDDNPAVAAGSYNVYCFVDIDDSNSVSAGDYDVFYENLEITGNFTVENFSVVN